MPQPPFARALKENKKNSDKATRRMQQIFIICIHLRTLRMTMLACASSLLIPAIIIHLQIFANFPGNANMRFIIFMLAIFFTRLQAFPTVPKSNANMRSISVAILVNHLQQFANVPNGTANIRLIHTFTDRRKRTVENLCKTA